MSKKKLTQKRLKEVLFYDPKIGDFIWKISTGNVKIGDIASCLNFYGYIRISVDGVRYKAHRLAWLYEYGYFPENDLDHIDRIKTNNRIKNLREASRSCNMRNTGNQKNNTSGIKGICFDKANNKWESRIKVNRITKHLGRYKDFNDAVCARLAGEQCLNWSSCDSNSPAYQYVKKHILTASKDRYI